MLGDTIDAETADRYGLVTQLLDDADDLDGACAALARRLADGPTLGLQQTKSPDHPRARHAARARRWSSTR